MTLTEPPPPGADLNVAAAVEISPAVWVGWPAGPALPPWMDRFDDPTFDSCWEADRLQDLAELAAEVVAERFGPLDQLTGEREQQPRPRWILLARPATAAAWSDDEVTIARRRRVLDDALGPAEAAPPAGWRRRRRRIA